MKGFQTRHQNKENPYPQRLEIHIFLSSEFGSYFKKMEYFLKERYIMFMSSWPYYSKRQKMWV